MKLRNALLFALALGIIASCSPSDDEGGGTPPPSETGVTLNVELNGQGAGSVRVTPGNETCEGTCDLELNRGTQVILEAVPGPNSRFGGWNKDCIGSGESTTCRLTADGDKNVTATFILSGDPSDPSDPGTPGTPQSLTATVATGSDDAEQFLETMGGVTAGQTDIQNRDLDMVNDIDSTQRGQVLVGVRFADVALPADAEVTEAYLQFTADAAGDGDVTFTIEGQANADAPTFAAEPNDISSRPTTDATVNWSPPAWNEGDAGTAQRTADVSDILNEIIGSGDWNPDSNGVVFVISGEATSDPAQTRLATSFDGGAAAQLVVSYTSSTGTPNPPPAPPPAPAVNSVSIDQGSPSVQVGDTATLSATVDAVGGADASVTWRSDNESAATVNADTGVVTGVAVGTATLTATSTFDTTRSDSAQVTVTTEPVTPAVTEVTVTPERARVEVGKVTGLKAAVSAAGNADEAVTWTSSDEGVATVDGGAVTGVAAGSVTITATSVFNPDAKDTAAVEVTQPPTGTLTGTLTAPEGSDLQGTTVVACYNGNCRDSRSVSTTVTQGGSRAEYTVGALREGQTYTVFASKDVNNSKTRDDGDLAGFYSTDGVDPAAVTPSATDIDFPLSVLGEAEPTPAVNDVTIDQNAPTVQEGSSLTLSATVDAAGGADETVTWRSDDEGTATVNADTGEVTGVSEGTAQITATSTFNADESDTVTLSVRAATADPTVQSVTIDQPDTQTLRLGDTVAFSATVTPAEVAQTVTWESDNADAVTVDADTGAAEAVGEGTATITATSTADPGKSDSVTLTVAAATSEGYTIEFIYSAAVDDSQKPLFEEAAARWSEVITEDLEDIALNKPADDCFQNEPAFRGTVDDLVIYVDVSPREPNILASAGPCLLRPGSGLTAYGTMLFNSDYFSGPDLFEIILHEIGHVLGVGTLWEINDMVNYGFGDPCPADPRYTGAGARAEWRALGGSGDIPLEDEFGAGTACAHWDEGEFFDELMTGFSQGASAEPLSRMTVASLEDVGYQVDRSAADSYTLPVCSPFCVRAPDASASSLAQREVLLPPVGVVTSDGSVERFGPGLE